MLRRAGKSSGGDFRFSSSGEGETKVAVASPSPLRCSGRYRYRLDGVRTLFVSVCLIGDASSTAPEALPIGVNKCTRDWCQEADDVLTPGTDRADVELHSSLSSSAHILLEITCGSWLSIVLRAVT